MRKRVSIDLNEKIGGKYLCFMKDKRRIDQFKIQFALQIAGKQKILKTYGFKGR